ncbi:MAG TPA: tetratricopeptide repeat protein [Drouetiella sp.]
MEARWLSYKEQAERAVQQNKLEHAESLWYAALQDAESFPPNDPRLTITLECLAELLFKQRKYSQAEPLCERTLQIYENTIGPNHPDVGILANNLAMLYHMQDKFEQAETLYKKALNVQTKALGAKHPEVINLLGNYANLLFRVHRDAEGEQMRAMAKSATTGKWNMSGRYQAYNAGGVVPSSSTPPGAVAQASGAGQSGTVVPSRAPGAQVPAAPAAASMPGYGASTPGTASSSAPGSAAGPPATAPSGAPGAPQQFPPRHSQQQQSETAPILGKVLKTVGAPPPTQKPVMPESPQVPLPPPSTDAPPAQSGIKRLMQQRKETLQNP